MDVTTGDRTMMGKHHGNVEILLLARGRSAKGMPADCVSLISNLNGRGTIVLPLSILCVKAAVQGLPSREAVRSPTQLAEACGVTWRENQDFTSVAATNSKLRIKVKSKKQHEIDRVVTAVRILKADEPIFNTVIDIGAGIGHLSRVLSVVLPDCRIIAIEQNSDLVEKSIHITRQLCRSDGSTSSVTPAHRCQSLKDGFDVQILDDLQEGQKALLIGLHPCGGLSTNILRMFLESPKVSAMILFGCCYHKVSSPHISFPLSSKYAGIKLSLAALDLACHGNEIYSEKLLTKPKCSFRSQCFRAVLEWLITNGNSDRIRDQKASIVVNSVNGYEQMTFSDYSRLATARCPHLIDDILHQAETDERVRDLIDRVDDEWRRFLALHCLRLLFSPLIEYLLIADRQQYLEENGYSVAVVPLFDPKISPRNFALITTKSASEHD